MEQNMMNPLHLNHLSQRNPPGGVSSSLSYRLTTAARSGNLLLLHEVITELRHGADGGERSVAEIVKQVKDDDGRTVLHLAAGSGIVIFCIYLVEELKFNVNVKDDQGDTPLNFAIANEQPDTSAYLLDNGAVPTALNNKGLTALHYAAANGNKWLMQLLNSRGADVNAHSHWGSPLYFAVVRDKKNAVEFLLENNANPNLFIEPLNTPLMSAVLNKSIDLVKLLLKAGADPNICSSGENSLILAAHGGHAKILKCLLEAGADPDKKDMFDMTLLEIGAKQGNHEVVLELFPLTTRIPSVPVWSFRGILKYAQSDEAERQRKLAKERKFEEAKSNGTAAFNMKDYFKATFWYSIALNVDPTDAAILSNRSLCGARLGDGDQALSDAKACIELKKDWPKAHYRLGAAYKLLKDFDKAAKAFQKGFELEPRNKDIQNALKEVLKLEAATKEREAAERREVEAGERMEVYGGTEDVSFLDEDEAWYEACICVANE